MVTLTPVTSRILALIVSTGLFAGTWANDTPDRVLAQKSVPLPKDLRVAHALPEEPEWVPISRPMMETPVMIPEVVSEVRISMGTQQKTFEVDGADLLIAQEVLQLHLDQLPLGLPVGRYRIVDPLGGVGWLTVESGNDRGAGTLARTQKQPPLISTIVDDATVQFIRIQNATVTTGVGSPIH